MNGNRGSVGRNPRLLLDASLSPSVANALALVGWDIFDVSAVFGNYDTLDPEIIDWCRDNGAVWVHADDRARRQHRATLQTSGIKTIWVYRQQGRMSTREQLRILSFVLPHLIERWNDNPRQRHYRVSAPNETAKPGMRPVTI